MKGFDIICAIMATCMKNKEKETVAAETTQKISNLAKTDPGPVFLTDWRTIPKEHIFRGKTQNDQILVSKKKTDQPCGPLDCSNCR